MTIREGIDGWLRNVRVFKTTNKDILDIQRKINEWIEENDVMVHQIEMVTGSFYLSKSHHYAEEIEIIIMIIYENPT